MDESGWDLELDLICALFKEEKELISRTVNGVLRLVIKHVSEKMSLQLDPYRLIK
jgi:hypothetical protein